MITKIISIEGGCHCGNIGYRLFTPVPPGKLAVRACRCSFCTKHGVRYSSHPHAELAIRIGNKDLVEGYRFSKKIVEFVFCLRCGVMPYVLAHIEGNTYAVININTADADFSEVTPTPLDLSSESAEDALARRKKVWIATVRFEE